MCLIVPCSCPPSVDWAKPIQTTEGLAARLLCTDFRDHHERYSHIVAVESSTGRETLYAVDPNGERSYHLRSRWARQGFGAITIINVPPPKKKVRLFVLKERHGMVYSCCYSRDTDITAARNYWNSAGVSVLKEEEFEYE